jgi:hypothetical protein
MGRLMPCIEISINTFMSREEKYYLLIKTHNKTNLKYLCKCKNTKDPYMYSGSGNRWKNHLKVHGNDLTTEIIGLYTLEEFRKVGEHYSKKYNVVESTEWANLINEIGDGGDVSKYRDYSSQSKMMKENNPMYKKEVREKISNIQKNIPKTNETKEKFKEAWVRKKERGYKTNFQLNNPGNLEFECEHCKKIVKGKGNYIRWHGENCKNKKT